MYALAKRLLIAAAMICGAVAVSCPSYAAAVVNVSLTDLGGDKDMPTNLGMNMGHDMSMATMFVKLDKTSVPAGEVTFKVTNNSKGMVHEVIVGHLTSATEKLPYVAAESRVDEEGSDHLGEVSELDPGKSGSLTLDLKPGTYILYCNVAGHYMSGMWSLLTVK